MIDYKWTIQFFLNAIVIYFIFSGFFLNMATACDGYRDTDFRIVQVQYDNKPDFFRDSLWLNQIRERARIQVNGGELELNQEEFLTLSPVVVSLEGVGCDFCGLRVILKNCENMEMDRATINENGNAVFHIPQDYNMYPVMVSIPLIDKDKSIYKSCIKESQLKVYLRRTKVDTTNLKLFQSLLVEWIKDNHHANQNIYNRIADILMFSNNDFMKKDAICDLQIELKPYLEGIDALDHNGTVYTNFKNGLNCLLN